MTRAEFKSTYRALAEALKERERAEATRVINTLAALPAEHFVRLLSETKGVPRPDRLERLIRIARGFGSERAIEAELLWTSGALSDGLREAHEEAITKAAGAQRGREWTDVLESERAWCAVVGDGHFSDLPTWARATEINGYACAALRVWQANSELSWLNKAIDRWSESLAIAPARSPERAQALENTSFGLLERYRGSGSEGDLTRALKFARRSCDETPATSSLFPGRLAHLATVLRHRYRRSGRVVELDEAVRLLERAVAHRGQRNVDLAMNLISHTAALRARFEHSNAREDIDLSIEQAHTALGLVPVDSPEHAAATTNYAGALHSRFVAFSAPTDLAESVDALVALADRTSLRASQWPARQCNAGAALRRQHRTTPAGDRPALGEAIRRLQEGLDRRPHSPEVARHLSTLAGAFRDRADVTGAQADVSAAREHSRRACELGLENAPEAAIEEGVEGGDWEARRDEWESARIAFSHAVEGGEKLVAGQASNDDKLAWLYRSQAAAAGIAEAEIRRGDALAAAIALERARAVLLSEVMPDRSWEQEIGIGRPSIAARGDTPLAYLASGPRSGVLVVARGGDWRAELVPGLEREAVAVWADRWRQAYSDRDSRWEAWALHVDETVDWLGATIGVQLSELVASTHPRAEALDLVLCGQLGALPAHAARLPDGSYLLERFAVSLLPNARWRASASMGTRSLDVLCIESPESADIPTLHQSSRETAASSRVGASVAVLRGAEATAAAIKSAMGSARVLHFSGHGQAFPLDPMRSALMLAGGVELTVSELSASPTPSPELVFLSACESAIAGARVPDEMLGLPAAFLGTGASAVIAGLWALGEDSTAEVVERFYHYWTDGGDNAAAALARAQMDLMRTGSPVVDWAALTYTGMPLAAASEWTLALGVDGPSEEHDEPIASRRRSERADR